MTTMLVFFRLLLADPLGIPAAFCYFLVRQRSRINPPVNPEDDPQAVVSAAGLVPALHLRGLFKEKDPASLDVCTIRGMNECCRLSKTEV